MDQEASGWKTLVTRANQLVRSATHPPAELPVEGHLPGFDGQPPGPAHGVDVDDQGNGTASDPRLYQLLRQPGPIDARTVAASAPCQRPGRHCQLRWPLADASTGRREPHLEKHT
jgi:hypothetical protein